jgi:methionine synthase II (cobalamin-independent)
VLSLSEKEVWPQWENLVKGLKEQLRQGSFLGEMWIQIDEPFWGEENKPHESYLEKVKKLGSELGKTRFGLHSCATKRPALSLLEMEAFHFLSFDCEKTEVSPSEKEIWKQWLKKDSTKILAWGAGEASRSRVDAWALEERQVWLSASCGLAYSGSFLAGRIF